jgi:glycosyltransferase involved in cell wall biosynthesis
MSPTGAPRVAVIVPARNAERYLPQAIDSMLGQTYRDWEAIIVDDASTDRTRMVAAGFAATHPDRIGVIGVDRNIGVPAARNAAIAAAKGGELIALLDSDDYWRDDYLERSVELFDEAQAAGRKVGIVACDALLETPEGIADQTFADVFGWVDEIDYDSMIERNYILARALFSRSAYDEVGGFAPDCAASDAAGHYAASDDYDLFLAIMEAGYEVVTTREPLAVYRYDPGSVSRNPILLADVELAAYRRVLERGNVTRRQRLAVKARMRHYRALRARGRVSQAITDRRPLAATLEVLKAAPLGLVAFLQRPSRWGEWAAELVRRPRRPSLR